MTVNDIVNVSVGPLVETNHTNEYKISVPIRSLSAKAAGIYNCVVEFPGSFLHLHRTAQLQGDHL